jgi:hypothetical protein
MAQGGFDYLVRMLYFVQMQRAFDEHDGATVYMTYLLLHALAWRMG